MRSTHLAMILALGLLAASCGSSSDTATTAASSTSTTTIGAPTTAGTPETTDASATTGAAETTVATATTPTATTTTVAPTTTFPGEPIEIGPRAGDVLAVVGVEYDDVLNVRVKPGVGQTIVATLSPTFDNIVALGVARKLASSIWYEVDVDGMRGWVSSSFTGYIGSTDDVTASIVAELGEIPVASSMEELAGIVVTTQASVDPESRVTTTVEASVGDLGEITMDVIGIGDDSVLGFRVVIFGQSEDGGANFGLGWVERTTLCGRGVTTDGLCT